MKRPAELGRRLSDALARPLERLGVRRRGRLRAVARKEVRQLGRDPLTLGFVIGVPLFQLALFGYAINQDIRHLPTAVLDHSRTAVSRQLVAQLEATQAFDVTTRVATEEEGRRLLVGGHVQVLVEVPGDFARRHYRGRGAEVAILVDATDPLAARAAETAADGLARELDARFQTFRVGGAGEAVARRATGELSRRFETRPDLVRERAVSFSVVPHFNPELRTPVFVVPGLLGVILTTTMILMTSVSLVRERERGTFELLIGTPVSRLELLVGKLLPYVGIGIVQVALVLAAGLLLFRVPVAGSPVDLAVASLLFIGANLTLGLVISSSVRTQLQATQIAFFFFLPSVLLSGFMFPFDAMPAPARWLGELLPLTHYIRLCRAILLRGAPLAELMGDLAALALFFAVGLAVAVRLFKKELG